MIEKIVLPTLYCPFPSAVNKHAATLHQRTLEWARRFHLLEKETGYQDLSASKNSWLVARTYPNAPLEELQVVSDWITWLFILDDVSEETGKQPDSLAAMYARFLGILKGAIAAASANPLECSLQDIRQRLLQKTTPGWMSRFMRRCEECWDSWVWEATNRYKRIAPDVESYTKMRPFTGGLMTFLEMIDIAEGIALPLEVREHPRVQHLTLIANNVVLYANDIFSLEKEIKQGDFHNLVLLLKQERNLPLNEAIAIAAEIYNGEVQAFLTWEQQLPSRGEPTDSYLNRYVSTLRFFMRANVEWSLESGRYQSLAMAG